MRLRKMIAILLMMLANVFMLAHAVTPHAHHNGVVCLHTHSQVKHNVHSNCDAADCSTDCLADQGHCSQSDNCDLQQIFERDGRSIQDGFSIYNFSQNNDLPTMICILGCCDLLDVDFVLVNKHLRYTHYTETYTSPYVGAIFGLRAPPFYTAC